MAKQVDKDLSRGKENELSKEAFVKVDVKKGQTDVYNLIDGNLCTYEISCLILGRGMNDVSGRFTELKKLGKIQLKGKKKINGANYSVYEKI